jgi:hypothetical protein
MRILDIITESNKFNNTILTETKTYQLWESAGRAIKEAALSPDQIQQLFQQIEQGATDSGANRTMLGKGKDAAAAVNSAWNELKDKVQSSKPIKAVDQKFDDAVAKIEKGLGGPDNKVNQVIQKYRAFAKDRPISQGLIYAALIAAAGISGAGLGGAAVLGLLKMTDKLLQGEKFSSAAYAGGKTGALAYGAGQVGQAMKGGDVAAAATTPKDSETFGLTAEPERAATEPSKAASTDTAKAAPSDAEAIPPTEEPISGPGGEFEPIWNGETNSYDIYDLSNPDTPVATDLSQSEAMKKAQDLSTGSGPNAVSPAADEPEPTAKASKIEPEPTADEPEPTANEPKQDIFTVGDNTMAKGLRATVEKMSPEDQEQTIAAWRVLVGDGDTQDKLGAGQLIKQQTKKYESVARPGNAIIETKTLTLKEISAPTMTAESRALWFDKDMTVRAWALNESLGDPRGGVYLTPLGVAEVLRRVDEGILDKIKGVGKGIAQSAKKGWNSATNKVTFDKLKLNWEKSGAYIGRENPDGTVTGAGADHEVIAEFLRDQGVQIPLINSVFKSMGIPEVNTGSVGGQTQAATATQGQQAQAGSAQAGSAQAGSAQAGSAQTTAAQQATDTSQAQTAQPADGATTAGTTAQAAGGRVGAKQAKQAIDQAVTQIKKVRSRDRTNVVNYGKTQLDAVPVKAATPADTTAAATPATATTSPRPKLGPTKVVGGTKPGAPTDAERAKLDQRIQQAMASQPQQKVAESRVYGGRYIKESVNRRLLAEFEHFINKLD